MTPITRRLRRRVARIVHRERPQCFACGRPGRTPCTGHEYGGTITGWTMRRPFRWMPAPWFWRIDCRWTLRERARPLVVATTAGCTAPRHSQRRAVARIENEGRQ